MKREVLGFYVIRVLAVICVLLAAQALFLGSLGFDGVMGVKLEGLERFLFLHPLMHGVLFWVMSKEMAKENPSSAMFSSED